jgi:hypothetical protein
MDDFWDLTVEEMDAIENEALQRINQQRNSSSSSSLPIPNEVFPQSLSLSLGDFVAVVRAISDGLECL